MLNGIKEQRAEKKMNKNINIKIRKIFMINNNIKELEKVMLLNKKIIIIYYCKIFRCAFREK